MDINKLSEDIKEQSRKAFDGHHGRMLAVL